MVVLTGAQRHCTCQGVDKGGVKLPCIYRFTGPSTFSRKTQRALIDEDYISHVTDVTEAEGEL